MAHVGYSQQVTVKVPGSNDLSLSFDTNTTASQLVQAVAQKLDIDDSNWRLFVVETTSGHQVHEFRQGRERVAEHLKDPEQHHLRLMPKVLGI